MSLSPMNTLMRKSILTLSAATLLVGANGSAGAQRAPVTVPIQVFNNHVYVRMQYEGQDLWLLLDSGAGVTLLDMAATEAFKVKLGRPANIGGVGPGSSRGATLSGVKLTLPEKPDVAVSPAIAMPMTGLSVFEGRAVNGILGADFFQQSVVELDYVAQEMRLHEATSFRYSGTGATLPLTFKDNKPHAVADVILADASRLPADCNVDVGSAGALVLTKPFVEKHRLLERVSPTIQRRAGRGAGGSAAANIGRVAGLRFGDSVITSPITGMYGDSAGVFSRDDFECNIGGEILRRFTVVFDYGRKQMILEPNASLREAFEGDMSGAAFRLDSAGLVVTDLMKGGPAEIAGLREADVVLAIDGRPALDVGVDALRRRLKRDGGEVSFRVRRPDGEVVVRLRVRRLI